MLCYRSFVQILYESSMIHCSEGPLLYEQTNFPSNPVVYMFAHCYNCILTILSPVLRQTVCVIIFLKNAFQSDRMVMVAFWGHVIVHSTLSLFFIYYINLTVTRWCKCHCLLGIFERRLLKPSLATQPHKVRFLDDEAISWINRF